MSKLQRIMLRKRIVYYLYCILILTIAYFLNRFFQMLIFILFFNTIQNSFSYRFHADTLFPNEPMKASNVCKLITVGVEIVYLIFCKELNVSIYSNLFVVFLIALINALLQFYLERALTSKFLLKNKDFILSKGEEVGLSKEAIHRLILRYIDKKSYEEIASLEYITVEAVKQSIRRSKRKLGL